MRALWAVLLAMPLAAQQWPVYGGDSAGSNYSALDKIDRSNVARLKPVWEWKAGEAPMPQFKATPPGMIAASTEVAVSPVERIAETT